MSIYTIENYTHYNTQAIEQLLEAVEKAVQRAYKSVQPSKARAYDRFRASSTVLHIQYCTLESGQSKVRGVGYMPVRKSIGIVRPHAMYGTEMEALAAVETSEQCLPEPALTQLALEMFRLYVVPQPLYTPRDVEMEKAQRLVKRLVAKGFKVRVETFLPKSPLVEEKKKKRTSQQVEKAMRRMQYSTQKLEMGISSLEFSIRSLEKLEPNLSDTQKQTLEQVKKLQATYVETILLTDKIE